MNKSLTVMFLLLVSSVATARCFTYVFLGVSDEKRHFDRAKWVEERASDMGCIVIKTHELDMKAAHQVLEDKLLKSKFNPNKDKLHISYVDHGSSSKLPFSKSEFVKYPNAMADLDSRLPKGTEVTFSSHICWPKFSETVISAKFKNIKSMCGGASVNKENLSTGYSSVSDRVRKKEYLPAGWDFWSDSFDDNKYQNLLQLLGLSDTSRKDAMKEVNLFNFHYANLGADMDDLVKGSSLTSGVFLKSKLDELGDKTYKEPFINFFSDEDSPTFTDSSDSLKKICINCSSSNANGDKFNDFLDLNNVLLNIKNKSVQKEIDSLSEENDLYSAYARLYKRSSRFIEENIKELNSRVTSLHSRKNNIIKLWDASDSSDYENLEIIENMWAELREDMFASLREYTSHLRKMNDVEMIVALKEKAPAELKKLESLMACERANALDNL
jgi:hypothetical protein